MHGDVHRSEIHLCEEPVLGAVLRSEGLFGIAVLKLDEDRLEGAVVGHVEDDHWVGGLQQRARLRSNVSQVVLHSRPVVGHVDSTDLGVVCVFKKSLIYFVTSVFM